LELTTKPAVRSSKKFLHHKPAMAEMVFGGTALPSNSRLLWRATSFHFRRKQRVFRQFAIQRDLLPNKQSQQDLCFCTFSIGLDIPHRPLRWFQQACLGKVQRCIRSNFPDAPFRED
jgi:hypothetical protein